jgi:uncharacterized membrane protein (UPF0127 family)
MRSIYLLSSAKKNILSLIVMFSLGFSILRMPSEKMCIEIEGSHVCLRVLRHHDHQRRGFQLVEQLPSNEGLLYIFHGAKKPEFWMRDVLQHLDIVFVDDSGCIVDIVSAEPLKEHVISPPSATLYAVEFPKGIVDQLGLKKGLKLLETSKLIQHHNT